MSKNEDKEMLYKLHQKIVYGAPGTGKSYTLSKEVKSLFKNFENKIKVQDPSNPETSFWLVGASWETNHDKYDEFIRGNFWENGYDEGRSFNRASHMKKGDYVIIKKAGLKISAIGRIEGIEIKGKKVNVEWLKKDMNVKYHGTYHETVHNITEKKELISEIFNNFDILKEEKIEISVVERVTFYDGYTYGQFIGAYKPVPMINESEEEKDISYDYVPGPLFRHLVKAFNNPNHKFVVIIEEINRARADRVFGNIFQLLDRDSSGKSEYPISLSEEQEKYLRENLDGEVYSQTIEKNGGLYLPDNFYIWATMNSADQGVYPMDSAFKRRWNFQYITLDKNSKNFGFDENKGVRYWIPIYETWSTNDITNYKSAEWENFRSVINETLLQEVHVPEDKLIPSDFVKPENFNEEHTWSEEIFWIDDEIYKNKILKYLFDDVLSEQGKDKIFGNDLKNFSKLIETYENGENIFNDEITAKIINKDRKYYIRLYKYNEEKIEEVDHYEPVLWEAFRNVINETLLQEVRVPEDRLIAPFFVKPENFDDEIVDCENEFWINNEIYKSKILMYLFDDVLRHRGKEKIFRDNLKSFSKLIETYENGENIFNDETTSKMIEETFRINNENGD